MVASLLLVAGLAGLGGGLYLNHRFGAAAGHTGIGRRPGGAWALLGLGLVMVGLLLAIAGAVGLLT